MTTNTTTGLAMLSGAAVLFGASQSFAGPPRFDLVDSGAKWVVHIDFEQAEGTGLGDWFLGQLDNGIDEDEFARELRGDLAWGEDIKGLTLYGLDGGDEESIVAVLQGSDELEALEERLWHGHKFLHGEEEIEVAGRSIIALGEPGDDDMVNIASVRGQRGGRTLIASPNREWLGRALRVAEGKRDGLAADAAIMEASSPPERAMVVVMATDLESLHGFDPLSRVAKQAGSVWGSVSERKGRLHVNAAVSAPNEEEADSIITVLRGVVALGTLIAGESDDENLEALIGFSNGLRFDIEGRVIRASLEVDASDVTSLLDSHNGGWDNGYDEEDDD